MAEDSIRLVCREVVAAYRDRKIVRETWRDDRRPDYPYLVLEVVPNHHLVGRTCDANTVTALEK